MLEQKFHSQTPNAVWLADITYIDTDEGWLYLAGVKDMATREIVGWAMEDHMRAELCCAALEMALGRRGPVPGLIHHSDRGGQYAGGDYRKLIKKAASDIKDFMQQSPLTPPNAARQAAQRLSCASAMRSRPSGVLGPVESPP